MKGRSRRSEISRIIMSIKIHLAIILLLQASSSITFAQIIQQEDHADSYRLQQLDALMSRSHAFPTALSTSNTDLELTSLPVHRPRRLLQFTAAVTGNASIKPLLNSLPNVPRSDSTLVYPRDLKASCQMQIIGNNATVNGITSASIRCQSADNTAVFMYIGSALLNFAGNFTGVYAVAPPANSGITLDQYSIYLRQTGSILVYNSTVDNLAIGSGSSFLTIDQGTSPVLIADSRFTRLTTCSGIPSAACFGALSVFNSTTYVQVFRSTFENTKCLNPFLCFSGAIIVSFGASLRLLNTNVSQSTGHFGGAILATAASNVKLTNSSFRQNTAIAGSFGGSLWLSGCSNSLDGKTTGYGVLNDTLFQENTAGQGGAVWVADCPNIVLRANTFDGNTAATADGGGVALLRSSNSLVTRNIFTNNKASTFGGSVSLQPCVPPKTASLNVFVGSSQANTVSNAGCGLTEVHGLNSSLLTAADQTAYNNFFNSLPSQVFPVVV
ncbi:hypothetical protein WJX74_006626 [Apatococcus lobatus]|uniref:Right handed beta helix domain-containing protein n=1 Tax=Apatococcus lobatus TaxID=904363 RepID=A0AAW1SGM2_9CHLO